MKDFRSIDKYLEFHNQIIQDLKDDKIFLETAKVKIRNIFNEYIININNPNINVNGVCVQYSFITDVDTVRLYTDILNQKWNDILEMCISEIRNILGLVYCHDIVKYNTREYIFIHMDLISISFDTFGKLAVFTITNKIALPSPYQSHTLKTKIYIYGDRDNYMCGVLNSESDIKNMQEAHY